MKSLLSVFLGIACLFFVSCSSTTAAKNLLGKQAPAVRFTMLDGSTVSLANLRGRTVVLVFWASWCSRSRRLIEDLNRLAEDIGNNIIFLAVSIDKLEREEKLREFIEYQHISNLRHSFSGNEIHDEAYISFGLDEIPHVFVIGPQGEVIAEGQSIDDISCAIPGAPCES